MAEEVEPDITKLLAQANAALNSAVDVSPLPHNDDLNEDNVEFTAEDMNDPELLNELARFDDSDGDCDGDDGDDIDGDEKVFEEMKSKALQSLKQKIITIENKGNAFREANNTANYKASMQCSKELRFVLSQINEMDSIEFVTDKDEIDAQINTVYDKIAALNDHDNANANDNDHDEEATERLLLERYKEYKFAAKKSNDGGDKSSAIRYLRQSKVIAKYVEEIREGIAIWISDVPPPLERKLWHDDQGMASYNEYKMLCIKARNEGNIELAKEYLRKMKGLEQQEVQQRQRPRTLSAAQQNDYSYIMKQLKAQIEECKSDALLVTPSRDELLRCAQQSQLMLQKVIECKRMKLETPKYERFCIKMKTLNVNHDIEENELRVFIGKLSNLATKGSTDIYLSATIDNVLNVETQTKKVKFSFDFNVTKRCKIERNKKLKHKIKFGKLNVCLFQNKLFSSVLMGSAVLKLKPLLETSSIQDTITIKSENERKKIADIAVEIKLRKPVLTEGHIIITKELIKITKFPEIEAHATTKAAPKPTPKPAPKATTNLPNGLSQAIVDNPLGVEYIESFECISHEMELCQQEIMKKGGNNCQEINERLQALNTNKSVLEVQVNNGLITLEQYTAKIKKAMITDLTLCKYLKTQNRKIEAVKVLQRYKTMKKEIQGT